MTKQKGKGARKFEQYYGGEYMKKVSVTARNQNVPCQDCGTKVGEVAKEAWTTYKYGGPATTFCLPCGKKHEDSTKNANR